MLLQEVHHRIKNNLVMVQSLLRLHARQLNNPQTDQAFQDAVNRIESIAILYDRIYETENYNKVLLDRYFNQLLAQLQQIYPVNNIEFETTFVSIAIANKTASPLGIIINELFTNSIKHAFPNGQIGKVKLSIQNQGDKIFCNYSDNGIGFDSDTISEGLGLSLIYTLVKQINGRITISSDRGFNCEIQFERE